MKDLTYWMQEVHEELERATEKFGPFRSAHEGHSIIQEEFEEMWEEIKKNDIPRSKEECIQVAAMSIRYLLDVT